MRIALEGSDLSPLVFVSTRLLQVFASIFVLVWVMNRSGQGAPNRQKIIKGTFLEVFLVGPVK
jgi:hypothetical protein